MNVELSSDQRFYPYAAWASQYTHKLWLMHLYRCFRGHARRGAYWAAIPQSLRRCATCGFKLYPVGPDGRTYG